MVNLTGETSKKVEPETASVPASNMGTTPASAGTYRPGGILTTPSTGGVYTWPSTTTSPVWSTTTTSRVPTPELVDLPTKMTRKVLIAFLDGDDEALWAKKLVPHDINIQFDEDGTARMMIELSLIKYFHD